MTWNYRVLRYSDGTLGIHEVFYEGGKAWGCTESPVGVVGDDESELRGELLNMLYSTAQPILDYDSIGEKE